MSASANNLPLAFVILDGFGIAEPSRGNAITEARLPFYGSLLRQYPVFSLAASGEAVGLPWGEPGNSEVGHLNLGAGRIVYQDVLRINQAIEDGSFFENTELGGAIAHCKKHNASLHILGILSDGGIHGRADHLYASLELAARAKLSRVFLHLILDGRDTPYNSAANYLKQLEKVCKRLAVGTIATVSGRFYAMDRDNHWDRIEQVYRAMVRSESAETFPDALAALEASYGRSVYDEEFVPVVIAPQAGGNGASRVQPGDSVIFTNYRPDRARELTIAFVLPGFNKFPRTLLSDLYFVTMSTYGADLPVRAAFKKEFVEYPLALALSEAGLSQLHIAETEKYAHVTYFFNGGQDTSYSGQENVIVPSAGVASYADKPEMSTPEITKKILESLQTRAHDVIIANFANADMVGHTGNLVATIQGLRTIDESLAAIGRAMAARGGVLIITADHGNAEEMVNWENGHIIKEHSINPVPCIIVGEAFKRKEPLEHDLALHQLKVGGVLSDVAPTILTILGLPIKAGMASRSLV